MITLDIVAHRSILPGEECIHGGECGSAAADQPVLSGYGFHPFSD
jgi:hypothetical protein